MASAHEYNHLETDTSQQPFDSGQTKSKLSWEDFSMFYRTANDWDYPVENNNIDKTQSNNNKTNEDIFRGHGSHASMDILADEMNTKWSYNLKYNDNIANDNNYNTNRQSLPDDKTEWKNTLSTTAQTSNADITAQQRMENFLDEDEAVILHKNPSITDSQGIDIADDTNIVVNEVNTHMKEKQKRSSVNNKDQEIKTLKAYIDKLQSENKTLIEENEKLKKRNGELRKTLHKAQQYRRKSSVAIQNLRNINTKINSLQQDNVINGNNNEEKVREEEELNNLKIQEQIQQAISMFQEEFGAELDEELNNIESFQYESLPDESGSEDNNNNEFRFDSRNIDDTIDNSFFNNGGTQRDNTVNDKYNTNSNNNPFQKNMKFAIKFTDANSNTNDGNNNTNKQSNDEYSDDEADDALPDSYNTPGGPSEYVTPGGPDMDMKAENINKNGDRLEMTINANVNDTRLKEMEGRLNDLSDKMLGLMERIQDLTEENQHLEVSKLELITNTCSAMNQYRDTIKRLSKQNQMLVDRIKAV